MVMSVRGIQLKPLLGHARPLCRVAGTWGKRSVSSSEVLLASSTSRSVRESGKGFSGDIPGTVNPFQPTGGKKSSQEEHRIRKISRTSFLQMQQAQKRFNILVREKQRIDTASTAPPAAEPHFSVGRVSPGTQTGTFFSDVGLERISKLNSLTLAGWSTNVKLVTQKNSLLFNQLVETGIISRIPMQVIITHLVKNPGKASTTVPPSPQQIASAFSLLEPSTLVKLIQYATDQWPRYWHRMEPALSQKSQMPNLGSAPAENQCCESGNEVLSCFNLYQRYLIDPLLLLLFSSNTRNCLEEEYLPVALSQPILLTTVLQMCFSVTHEEGRVYEAKKSMRRSLNSTTSIDSVSRHCTSILGNGGSDQGAAWAVKFFTEFLERVEAVVSHYSLSSERKPVTRHFSAPSDLKRLGRALLHALRTTLLCLEGKGVECDLPFTKSGASVASDSGLLGHLLFRRSFTVWETVFPSDADPLSPLRAHNVLFLLGPLARCVSCSWNGHTIREADTMGHRGKTFYNQLKRWYISLLTQTDLGYQVECRVACEDALHGLTVCAARCFGLESATDVQSTLTTFNLRGSLVSQNGLGRELEDLFRLHRESTCWTNITYFPLLSTLNSPSPIHKGNNIHLSSDETHFSFPELLMKGNMTNQSSLFSGYTPALYHTLVQAFCLAGEVHAADILFTKLSSNSAKECCLIGNASASTVFFMLISNSFRGTRSYCSEDKTNTKKLRAGLDPSFVPACLFSSEDLLWRTIRSFDSRGFFQCRFSVASRADFLQLGAAALLLVYCTPKSNGDDPWKVDTPKMDQEFVFKTPVAIRRIYCILQQSLHDSDDVNTPKANFDKIRLGGSDEQFYLREHERTRSITLFLRVLTLVAHLESLFGVNPQHPTYRFTRQGTLNLHCCLKEWSREYDALRIHCFPPLELKLLWRHLHGFLQTLGESQTEPLQHTAAEMHFPITEWKAMLLWMASYAEQRFGGTADAKSTTSNMAIVDWLTLWTKNSAQNASLKTTAATSLSKETVRFLRQDFFSSHLGHLLHLFQLRSTRLAAEHTEEEELTLLSALATDLSSSM